MLTTNRRLLKFQKAVVFILQMLARATLNEDIKVLDLWAREHLNLKVKVTSLNLKIINIIVADFDLKNLFSL